MTATDRKWLGHIIASGGVKAGREIPRRTLNRLRRANLIEHVTHPVPDSVCSQGVFYATAAGCTAFGSEIARIVCSDD